MDRPGPCLRRTMRMPRSGSRTRKMTTVRCRCPASPERCCVSASRRRFLQLAAIVVVVAVLASPGATRPASAGAPEAAISPVAQPVAGGHLSSDLQALVSGRPEPELLTRSRSNGEEVAVSIRLTSQQQGAGVARLVTAIGGEVTSLADATTGAPAAPGAVVVLDDAGGPTMAWFLVRDEQGRIYPSPGRRLARARRRAPRGRGGIEPS